MKKAKRSCDAIVDAFVAAVNLAPRDELSREGIPKACLLSAGKWPHAFDWQIVRSEDASWLPVLEGRLPFPVPTTFRSLISRYTFPAFIAGPLRFHAVGLPEPGAKFQEFRFAILADAIMSPFLLKQGFLPFARPASGSYDPVCFDCRNSRRKAEPAVVRVDHEEILCNDRLQVVEQLAAGFDVLLEETTSALEATTARSP
jgi:hypothetical protein